jgi:hypothetical protein
MASASAISLSAHATTEVDAVWTIDSSCTRHIAYKREWFSSLDPHDGSILVGGKNIRLLQDLHRSRATRDLTVDTIPSRATFFCSSCALAKSHRNAFPHNRLVERATAPLQKVHSDICGPLPAPSLSDRRYFVVLIDEFSRFMYTNTIAARSDLYACYTDFRCKARFVFRTDIMSIGYCANGHDPEVQTLQADNAHEYEKLGRLVLK